MQSELLGQAAPNLTYLGQRMLYERERDLEDLNPLTSARYLLEVLKRGGLVCFVWIVGYIPLLIVGAICRAINHTFGNWVYLLLGFAWWAVMGSVFWFGKLPAQLSEWKFSVDGKGPAVTAVFDHIAWAFRRRGTPHVTVQLRRFPLPGQAPRDLLEVRQGIFYGLVSCLPYGQDLYVGWSFWLYLSPFQLLLLGLRALVWELRFRGHAIYVGLQFDTARALREALHSAVREGVDMAAGAVAPQGSGTIGSSVPVVHDASLADQTWSPLTTPIMNRGPAA